MLQTKGRKGIDFLIQPGLISWNCDNFLNQLPPKDNESQICKSYHNLRLK